MAILKPVNGDPFATSANPLESALQAEGITGPLADVARSVYMQESGGGKNTRTSNAGAVGGMQIIPATFKRVADPTWDINEPIQNARAGVRYLKNLHELSGGDPRLTAVGYYGGEGAIDKARRGIAVSDPRNPNAPNTLQYGDQVVARIPQGQSSGVRLREVEGDPFAAASPAPLPAKPAAPAKQRAWSDVPLEAISNVPDSAIRMGEGLVQAVMNPLDTAKNVWDLAAGGLHNALPKSVTNFMDRADSPAATQQRQQAIQTADTVGGMYRDRYGSSAGIKNTLATDPVGVAADVSTLLGGGAALTAGKTSSALARASQVTNPLSVVGPAVRAGAKAVDAVGAPILGMTTGVGAENVRMAGRAGLEGKTAFMDNMNGTANMTDVLDTARQNIQNMGAQKSAEYRANMANVRSDKSVLNFTNIDDAVSKATGMVTFKGQAKNQKAAQVIDEIRNEVQNWKALDPAEFHTPEGLDALKQRIGGIVDSLPFEEKAARAAASNVYNSVKSEIATQAPSYSKAMKDYAEATETLREVERALSLGNKASADTAMRKLQSLSRNNASTNYGNRLDLARTLEVQGGNEILPAIAGQAMNSWTPRSLSGQAGGIATLGTIAMNPLAAAALPFQSPRALGTGLYGAGRAAAAAQNTLARSPVTAEQLKWNALLKSRAGSIPAPVGQDQ